MEKEEKEKHQDVSSDTSLMRAFKQGQSEIFTRKYFLILFIVILLGFGTGYLLSMQGGKGGSLKSSGTTQSTSIPKGTAEGSEDTKTFIDLTEGILHEGGIDGEGQYHLVRPGGESQNVYLTSSVIDLSKYLKRKVKVWGQTNKAQKAGWLMDVGRVEVLE